MDIGISSYAYTWAVGVPEKEPEKCLTIYDLINKAEEYNVPVVQVADNLPLDQFSANELGKIKETAKQKRIRIEPGARKMSEEMLEKYIHIAHLLDSPVLRFVIDGQGFCPEINDIHYIIKNSLSSLKENNIILAIENHDRFKAKEFASMVEKAASSHVGICLDTVNSLGAGEGLDTVIDILAPLTVNLHVKEFTIERVFHQMGFVVEGKPLGKGMLPVPYLLDKVSKRCTSAILEQWTPPESNIHVTIKKEQDWADQSINYLKSIM